MQSCLMATANKCIKFFKNIRIRKVNGQYIFLRWEIHLAIGRGCMLNVDSFFDAENIVRAAYQLKKTARVLIRVNPQLERTAVHQYLATALKDSKFGVPLDQFDKVAFESQLSLQRCKIYVYIYFLILRSFNS